MSERDKVQCFLDNKILNLTFKPVSQPSDTTFPIVSVYNKRRAVVNICKPLKTEKTMATEAGVTVTRLRSPVRAGKNPHRKMTGERSTKKRQSAPLSHREN